MQNIGQIQSSKEPISLHGGSGGMECNSMAVMNYTDVYIKNKDRLHKTLKKKFGEKVANEILQGYLQYFSLQTNKDYIQKLKEKEDEIKLLKNEINTLDSKLKSKHQDLQETLNKLQICRRSIRIKPKSHPAPKPPPLAAPSTGDEIISCGTPAKHTSLPSSSAPSRKPHHFCSNPSTSDSSSELAQDNKLPWNNAELRRLQLNDARWHKIIKEKERNPQNRKLQNFRLYNGVLFWSHTIHPNSEIKLCVPELITISIIKMIEKTLHNISVDYLLQKIKNFFM